MDNNNNESKHRMKKDIKGEQQKKCCYHHHHHHQQHSICFLLYHILYHSQKKIFITFSLSLSLWLYLGHIRLIIFSFIQTNKQAMKTKQNKRNKHHINDDNILVVCVFWSVIYTGFLLSEFIFLKTKQKIPQTDSNGMGQDSWVFLFVFFLVVVVVVHIN